MRFLKLTVIISLLLLTLAGCGQRGPLYLPEEQPVENQSSQEEDSQQSQSINSQSEKQTTQDSILDSNY